MNKSYFQSFDNITFSELYSTQEEFVNQYKAVGFPQEYEGGTYITDDDLKLIWLLLIGKYADSTIKPFNVYGAFQVRFMSKIWQYAPAWKKELDIQNKLRALSLDDGSELYEGGKALYNSALNPGTDPSAYDSATGEINFLNAQNVTKYKKSKIEGLAMLTNLLKTDVTELFLKRFEEFFKTIIYSGRTLYYETEGDN